MSREEILRRFESWLDTALAAEPPPGGIDAELLAAIDAGDRPEARSCDSYALWSAMTALSQEVKLQGRTFKELNETLGAQPRRIAEEVRASYAEREREIQRETERRCRKDALNALIDLRDRMGRGLESVRKGEAEMMRAGPTGWLTRVFAKPVREQAAGTIAALTRGYELALERLDQALDEGNATEIRCLGERFDPRRMNAIDRQASSEVPEGTVLEVYRSGYEWNGEIFRTAQVKVSSKAETQHE
jgi:molecular chaperone GrpE